jgi:hypothetical protein
MRPTRAAATAAIVAFVQSPCFLLAVLLSGCDGTTRTEPIKAATKGDSVPARKFNFTPSQKSSDASASSDLVLKFPNFVDVAGQHGIVHSYDNGASSKSLMVESTGGGCGWIDYDRDGNLDLFLTQGGQPDAPSGAIRPPDSLFRQLADGHFVDVAEMAWVGDRGYGQGVAVGDLDNDGFDDLFVANVGRCSLYLNQGDGTFRPLSEALEGKRDVWSTSAAWGDIDRDGDLDLYICNYAIYDPYHPISCRDKNGNPTICHPRNVEPEPDEFFLNHGDGTFVESSQKLGLYGPGNKALGVVIADLNDDDWPDIYVANDTTPNFLFINEKGLHFTESSLVLGGAVSATGEPQASMGIAFGDYDGNGLPDLCLTHFTGESNTLYQNLGPQGLHDVSAVTGMRELTLPKLAFGTVMSDFNADGHMDIFFANGHIDPKFSESEGYEMTPQLFSFDGRRWRDGSSVAGEFFQQKAVGRGVASADFDRDGDLDLVVVRQNSTTALLRNESSLGHGLRISVLGLTSNRNGFNAKVTVTCGSRRMTGEFAGGTSYAAAHERLLCFGLDGYDGPCAVQVRWPSGTIDSVEVPHPDRLVLIAEGEGLWNPVAPGNDR